jgi:hypothetical protein
VVSGFELVIKLHACLSPGTFIGLLWCLLRVCRHGASSGHAIAQVVSHRLLTAEARNSALGCSCTIFGGPSGPGTGFSPSPVSPLEYHSNRCLIFSHVSSGDGQWAR